LPIITWYPFPTYLLIFPEKNQGILAGEYDSPGRMIRVEANSYHKNSFKLRRNGEAFLFALFQNQMTEVSSLLMGIS
jgi:hypothetical protein